MHVVNCESGPGLYTRLSFYPMLLRCFGFVTSFACVGILNSRPGEIPYTGNENFVKQ